MDLVDYPCFLKHVVSIDGDAAMEYQEDSAPPGFFRVGSVSKTKSLYSSLFSFVSGMSQEEVLGQRLHSQDEEEMDVMVQTREILGLSDISPDYRVLEQNPLNLGYLLYSIEGTIWKLC